MMEELPTMESVLRALREMTAEKTKRELDAAAAPQPLPEEIERAIRE